MAKTDAWLTRSEAAELTGISIASLIRYEETGELHPKKGESHADKGKAIVILYDPAELVRVARKRRPMSKARDEGMISGRAFVMFEEGASLKDVVIKLQITPEQARKLHSEWEDLGGSDLVITPNAKKELERQLGSFDDVAGLCERVRSQLDCLRSKPQASFVEFRETPQHPQDT